MSLDHWRTSTKEAKAVLELYIQEHLRRLVMSSSHRSNSSKADMNAAVYGKGKVAAAANAAANHLRAAVGCSLTPISSQI